MVATESAAPSSELSSCVACGTTLSVRTTGRPRRYCDERCRKRAGRSPDRDSSLPTSGLPGGGMPTSDRDGVLSEGVGHPGFAGVCPSPGRPDKTAGQEFPDNSPSRYYAKFASAPGQDGFFERKVRRGRLLHLLREVTTVDRCKGCGWEPLGQAVVLKAGSRDGRNTAGFGGLERCGRIWLCPECAAKIRLRRGEEIAEAISRHLDGGGGAYFWTVAIPHEHGDKLKVVFGALADMLRIIKRGRPHQRDKKRYGILGEIKAVEVTHGRNGWHPHAHILVVTDRVLSFDEWTAWAGSLDLRVADALRKVGWDPGLSGIRSTVKPVDKGAGLAAYLTKVQEKGLGNEIARADLKGGRKGGRTPFEILADFGEYGLADDLELWWEYEKATAGRSAIRWNKGLRALLLPDVEQKTDDEIAAEDEGSDAVAHVTLPVWNRIRRDPDIRLACEFAAAEYGWDGLLRVLIAYRISPDGVYTPEQWATANEVDLDAE